MSERTCVQCGGLNRPDASYCWQCYAPFGPTATSQPVRAGRIGPAASVGNGSVVPGPAPATVAESPSRGGRTGLVVGAVVFVVAFAAGWWAVQHFFFGGFPFPDRVAGEPRVQSEEVRDAAEAVASIAEILDVEMEMAFYGTATEPAYFLFAFEIPDSAFPGAQPFSPSPSGDVPFQCASDAQGAGCVWEHDGTVVGIGGIGQTPEQLEPVARRVQADLLD